MGRKHQAEQLLRSGFDASAIAQEMNVSFATVLQYLCTRVGERALRHSDIYFAIPKDKRQTLQNIVEIIEQKGGVIISLFPGVTWEDVNLFRSLRDRRIFAGDMYEYISETEIVLHEIVRRNLVKAFPDNETDWWRKGISSEIREKCASRCELDEEPSDSPFAYTDLLDLWKVIAKNWQHFGQLLPPEYSKDRKKLERDLRRLNTLRNTVMHPVKGRKWSEDDFLFVRNLQRAISSIDSK